MKISYICNCQMPCSSSVGCTKNGGPCSHTSDVNFAKNYKEVPLVMEDSNFVDLSNGFDSSRYYEVEK